MFNVFMKWLVPKLESWCENTNRSLMITGKQGPEDVYLARYFLFRSKYFSIYIHRFLRSDIDDPHDHPFNFLGYVVSGNYKETMYESINSMYNDNEFILMPITGVRGQGKWAYRKATTIHKVEVDEQLPYSRRKEATLTIIFRGPYVRDWNFYKILYDLKTILRSKKIQWNEYLGIPKESRE